MTKMKTYITLFGVSMMLSGAMIACGSRDGGSDIGKDKAASIALEDAGIAQDDASRFRVSKDLDDGIKTYDVQFTYGNMEYEYEIQASDGTILNTSTETVDGLQASVNSGDTQNSNDNTSAAADENSTADNSTSSAPSGNSTHKNATNGITWEEAAALALERVTGASEQDLRMELEFDDGYEKYEGEIIYNQIEYDFEIDASTGKFLEWSEDRN